MVRFLIHRPVAVLMSFLALVILGCVCYFALPVTLMPDIDVPEAYVRLKAPGMTARDIESAVAAPLRSRLSQMPAIENITSEATDGALVVKLTLGYGVDMHKAVIEINERVDDAVPSLPPGVGRPVVSRSAVADIPVVYVQITPASGEAASPAFYDFASGVVRRRLLQLPEIAAADMTGAVGKELAVIPRPDRMASAGVSVDDIQAAIVGAAGVRAGEVTVRDGLFEYKAFIDAGVTDAAAVAAIPVLKNGVIRSLGDFCDIDVRGVRPDGYSSYMGRPAVTLALVKHPAASMDALDAALDSTLEWFARQEPAISITKSRSQTQLLDITVDNLRVNILLGLVLIFALCLVVMGSLRVPAIVAVSVLVAVVVTFIPFFLLGVGINIISLAGLIPAVGMMIDNSLIVAENITQYRRRGLGLDDSCVSGTNEMITPMLSSSLTTVAVFLPLVFMSGMAGEIFADQAFAITAGLAVSYAVSITLLPVLYSLLVPRVDTRADKADAWLTRTYDRTFDRCFARPWVLPLVALGFLAAIWPLGKALDVERLPEIDSDDFVADIVWPGNPAVAATAARVAEIERAFPDAVVEYSAFVGPQDFILPGPDAALSPGRARIYVRARRSGDVPAVKDSLERFVAARWPAANLGFAPKETALDRIFPASGPALRAEIYPGEARRGDAIGLIDSLKAVMSAEDRIQLSTPPVEDRMALVPDLSAMALYGVSSEALTKAMSDAFGGEVLGSFPLGDGDLPVRLDYAEGSPGAILAGAFAKASPGGVDIPLSALVRSRPSAAYRSVTADAAGEYVAVTFDDDDAATRARFPKAIRESLARIAPDASATFSGMIFENERMMRELAMILIVSLVMMYFILAAQFESFLQPLIVLVEIPLDIAFALVFLFIFGESLNLMSAIGIIVSCGIVVNDSILKIDSVNDLRRAGMPVVKAVHVAGRRRLKSIVMTSLTTILAMVPVFFASDAGSELQRPLAVAVTGAMTIGTAVSIYLIPLLYCFVYERKDFKTRS